MRWYLLLLYVNYVKSIYYDTFTGNPVSNATIVNMRALNLIPWCIIDIEKCDPHEYRRMDLSCNNLHLPSRGASMTPFARMLPAMFGGDGWIRNAVSGRPLPNVRAVRVAVIPDGRIANKQYTQLVTHFQVFVTGDVSSVHDTANYVSMTTTCCTAAGRSDPRCNSIEVYPDDVYLRRSGIRCLNLTTAITYSRLGCVPDSSPRERINTASPLLDLSNVYGHTGDRALRARELVGGRLQAELLKGMEWPPSGAPFCVNNEAPNETRCHDSALGGVNSVLGLNIIFLWFFRNHNLVARKLQELNPCWDDDKLYFIAREINIAMHNQIFYYELMPALAGTEFLLQNGAIHNTMEHVNDYDPQLMPTTTIDYVTASRWYHSLQEGRLNLYTKDGRLYDQLAVVDFTLRTGALPLNNTIEGITQGAFRQPCGTSERVVDPDVGERILGRLQSASDVISSDIMKTRDFGMPSYLHYRAACGLPVPKQFKDLLGWMDREQVEALALAYESVFDIDIQVGILAERPMPGVALGPTFACITVHQMKRWRQADRFWYENDQHPGAFNVDQLYEIRKMTVAKILCDNGDQVDRIQPNAFLLIGEGNELNSCSKIEGPNLDAWKDESCQPKYNNKANIPTSHQSDYDHNWNNLEKHHSFVQEKDLNLDRLRTPWVGVIQPLIKDRRNDILNTERPFEIPPVDEIPDLTFGEEIDSSNIESITDKSAFEEQDAVIENLEDSKPLKSNKVTNTKTWRHVNEKLRKEVNDLRNVDVKNKHLTNNDDIFEKYTAYDPQIQASESTARQVDDKIKNNVDYSAINNRTNAQAEFLRIISRKGEPGFAELGFFSVL